MRLATFSFLALFTASTSSFSQTFNTDKRLVFSTYHGGDRNDDAVAVAVDPLHGFVYMTGETESRDLNASPVGGKPLTAAVFKGYLTKYDSDGKTILWRLLIGGSSNTVPKAIALDADGNIFVAGTTGARDLPLKNPVQDKQPGLNIAFLMKFEPVKGDLLFSTYFGGERNEEGRALAVDSQGNVYLAGRATSTTMPVKNALQPKFGGSEDGFIAKYTPDLTLAYATYLGGESSDQIHAIAVGPDDSLYVTGETMSPGRATADAYIRQMQSWSSFAARISPEGDAITWFTYLGWRGGYTVAKSIAVDSEGRAWIGGHTTSKQLPTTANALQRDYAGGMRDGFLVRLSADGTDAGYASYLGGSASGPTDPDETINAIRVDARGHIHIAGQTNSEDFPGNNRAFQPASGGAFDAYLLRLIPGDERTEVPYASFWGGVKTDGAVAIALGPGESVTFVGNSSSADFPVSSDAAQLRAGSVEDGFVTQVCDPWLATSHPSLEFTHTQGTGAERPGAVEIDITAGCPLLKFDSTGPEVTPGDTPWLSVTRSSEGTTVPAKLWFEITSDPETMEPGEYKASIRITVPDAYVPVLEIPVVLRVVASQP